MNSSAPAAKPPPVAPYALLDGADDVGRVVNAFYDIMEQDPVFARLRGIHAADLGPMRARLTDFLAQWLGGPVRYAERHPGRPCIASAHAPFDIDAAMAEDWMTCMQKAFDRVGVSADFRRMVEPALAEMCQRLRNDRR